MSVNRAVSGGGHGAIHRASASVSAGHICNIEQPDVSTRAVVGPVSRPKAALGRRIWLAALAGLSVLAVARTTAQSSNTLLTVVDHLVYATPDLRLGVERIETLLGVRASPGGQHPGRGTRNALLSLGPTAYLEIIGPDPEQPAPALPRPFGIDDLREPKLVAWAAKGRALERRARDAARGGVTLGEVISGSRRRTDWRHALLALYRPPHCRRRRHCSVLHRLGEHAASRGERGGRGVARRLSSGTSRRGTGAECVAPFEHRPSSPARRARRPHRGRQQPARACRAAIGGSVMLQLAILIGLPGVHHRGLGAGGPRVARGQRDRRVER